MKFKSYPLLSLDDELQTRIRTVMANEFLRLGALDRRFPKAWERCVGTRHDAGSYRFVLDLKDCGAAYIVSAKDVWDSVARANGGRQVSYQSMTDEERAKAIMALWLDYSPDDICLELQSAFTSIRNEAIAEERERICDILMEEAREYAESDPESTDQMIASSLAKISSAIRSRTDAEKG